MKKDIQDMLTYLIQDAFGKTKYQQYTLQQMKDIVDKYISDESKKRNIKPGNAEYNMVRRLVQKAKRASSKEQLLTDISETLLAMGGYSI